MTLYKDEIFLCVSYEVIMALNWKPYHTSVAAATAEEELLVGECQPQEASEDFRAARGPGSENVQRRN